MEESTAEERNDLRVAFGPVGLAGIAIFLLGVLRRSPFTAFLGLGGVVADVTVAELGGFKRARS